MPNDKPVTTTEEWKRKVDAAIIFLRNMRDLNSGWKPTFDAYDECTKFMEDYRAESKTTKPRVDNWGQIVLGIIPFVVGLVLGLGIGPFITGLRGGLQITDELWRVSCVCHDKNHQPIDRQR